MAKNTFYDWDTTASNNTDVGGIGILGTNAVSNFDDALRTVMAQLRSGVDGVETYATKSGNYTALATDKNAVHRYTATATVSLTAAATLGANWHYTVIAAGGDVTIDPNGAETINGAATYLIAAGTSAVIVCSGTSFSTVSPVGQQGFLVGLTLSNNASDSTNDIDIAIGQAAADVVPYTVMGLSSTLTKRLDAAWAVGSGNGGLDTGSIANGTYHVWLIQRSDTGVVDALFSTSATSPTMPANYDRKRRIGCLIREAGTIVAGTWRGDTFTRAIGVVDRSSTAGAASTLFTLSAPNGLVVQPIATIVTVMGTAGNIQTQVGDAGGTLRSITGVSAAGQMHTALLNGGVFTNTGGQIQFAVAITSGTLNTNTFVTNGWIDTRGRT